MLRNALATTAPAVRSTTLAARSRAFHVSPIAGKSATEKVKEAASKVNMSVGKGLASAIEKGEEATETTKDTLAPAVGKAKELTGQASQKANQTSAGVREGAQDFKHDVKKEAQK